MIQIQLLKLVLIFVIIIGLVLMKRPLGQAILASALAVILLYHIPLKESLLICFRSLYEIVNKTGGFVLSCSIYPIFSHNELSVLIVLADLHCDALS